MFPEQSEEQISQRMSEMFKTGRLNPRAVGVWLDALEQQEYVPAEESHEVYLCRMDQYPYPYAARERDIADRLLADSMRAVDRGGFQLKFKENCMIDICLENIVRFVCNR